MRIPKRTLVLACLPVGLSASHKLKPAPEPSPLDRYIETATIQSRSADASIGSLYSVHGRFGDGVRDLRASEISDLVTIIVSDRASAVSSGGTNTARKSSAKASVASLAGPTKAAGVLSNLADLTSNQQLQGQGTTTRQNALTTTLTASVTRVMPNGNLIVEGQKEISVNSEHQVVTVRGVIRPEDLSATNSVTSDRLAALEIRVNGKGVVSDAVKRPFILYRLLLGLLPF